MKLQNILVFLAAGLTLAAPVPALVAGRGLVDTKLGGMIGVFKIVDFRFTCTTNCEWNFQLGTLERWFHKSQAQLAICHGTIDQQTYQDCSVTDDEPDRQLRAYVEKETGILKLQGRYLDRRTNKILYFEAEKHVYTETGRHETYYKADFMVPMYHMEST